MSSYLTTAASSPLPTQRITLKVMDQQGNQEMFRIGVDTKLYKLMNAYCEKKRIHYDVVRFIYENRKLKPNQTPRLLAMAEGDEILAVIELIGGGF